MTTPACSARLWLTTYRKGMLARLGHDLRIELGRFEVELERGQLHGRFDLRSLRVLGALDRGQLRPGTPSTADKATIERAIAQEILQTQAHPEAVLSGQLTAAEGSTPHLSAELQLRGRSAPLHAAIAIESDVLRATVELVPSRFGIAPYRAMGGALRLDDRVLVEVELARDCPGFELGAWATSSARWAAPG